jgi:hypothetical protein
MQERFRAFATIPGPIDLYYWSVARALEKQEYVRELLRAMNLRGDALVLLELLHKQPQGRHEAEVIQDARPEIGRDRNGIFC